ncbi:MAG: DNA recombination protein RmuC [Nitrospirota bacterium]
MEAALFAVSLLTLILMIFLISQGGKRRDGKADMSRLEGSVSDMKISLGASLSQHSMALTDLIARTNADMRQEVADRLSKGITEMRDRVESQHAMGREESAKSMTAMTEAVIKRLGESGVSTELRITALEKKTTESLDAIRNKVDERLTAIGQQVQAKLDENIKEGFSHFAKVQEHLKKAEMHLVGVSAVGASINELNQLLKLPHLRGDFGESTLEMLIADFLPASLYEREAQIGGSERVDVLVKLPGASLPIDSKFPREQVLPLFDSCDAAALAEARRTLSRVVKEQAKDIASKYIRPEHGTTNMALMFLPSETLYFEVVRDGELWAALQKLNVYPVSPNTLAVTLKGLTLSYKYYEMSMGVDKTIENIQRARKHFRHFQERFDGVGRDLDRARDSFTKASTHLGRYSSSVTKLTGEPDGEQDILPEPETDQPALPESL